ncbi:MAG TPA: hypothetical protein VF334_02045 [Polyangia bacterium]
MTRLLVLLALSTPLGCQHHKPAPASAAPAEAPPPPVTLPIGVSSCDDYLRRVSACQKLTPAARDAFTRGAGAWKAGGATSAKSCEDVAKTASAQLAELGC